MISLTNHDSRVRENSEVVMKFTQIIPICIDHWDYGLELCHIIPHLWIIAYYNS